MPHFALHVLSSSDALEPTTSRISRSYMYSTCPTHLILHLKSYKDYDGATITVKVRTIFLQHTTRLTSSVALIGFFGAWEGSNHKDGL